jgi:hypothetical protein
VHLLYLFLAGINVLVGTFFLFYSPLNFADHTYRHGTQRQDIKLQLSVNLLGINLVNKRFGLSELISADPAGILSPINLDRNIRFSLGGSEIIFRKSDSFKKAYQEGLGLESEARIISKGYIVFNNQPLWKIGGTVNDFTIKTDLGSLDFTHTTQKKLLNTEYMVFESRGDLYIGDLVINNTEVDLSEAMSIKLFIDRYWSIPVFFVLDFSSLGLQIVVEPARDGFFKDLIIYLNENRPWLLVVQNIEFLFYILAITFFVLYQLRKQQWLKLQKQQS